MTYMYACRRTFSAVDVTAVLVGGASGSDVVLCMANERKVVTGMILNDFHEFRAKINNRGDNYYHTH